MKIIGVNGINTHGEGNIDLLMQCLADKGHECIDIQLPMRRTISSRWAADDDGEVIKDFSEPGDVLVSHSFGCLRAAYAMMEVDYSAVFLFNPAMDRRWDFSYTDADIFCFHSLDDWVIFFGSMLAFHPFGLAGRVGFEDEDVYNIRVKGGHNAMFKSYLDESAAFVHNILTMKEDTNDENVSDSAAVSDSAGGTGP